MMNKLVLFSLFAAQVFGLLERKDFGPLLTKAVDDVHKECKIITGVTEEQISRGQRGNLDFGPDMTRYVGCLWLHSGVMSKNFHPNTEYLISLEPEKMKGKFHKIFIKCLKKAQESNETDFFKKAIIANNCRYETDPENYYLP